MAILGPPKVLRKDTFYEHAKKRSTPVTISVILEQIKCLD
jgi:hypothetical protein